MRQQIVSQTGTGSSTTIPMNLDSTPFNVGFGVVVTGTVNYTIQHTFDDPFASNFDPSTATWFNHTDLTSQSTSQDGNYAFPVRAIRLNVSSTDDDINFYIAQAGIGS